MLKFFKKFFSNTGRREDVIRLGKIIQQANDSVKRDHDEINSLSDE